MSRNVSYPEPCADCLQIDRCSVPCICPGCSDWTEHKDRDWPTFAPLMRNLSMHDVRWNWSVDVDGTCSVTEIAMAAGYFMEVTNVDGIWQVWEDSPARTVEIIWEGDDVNACIAFVFANATVQ